MNTIQEILNAVTKQIVVEWRNKHGEWLHRPHQNEGAAAEFERKLDKYGIEHRRRL